ncbi:MAG: (2Fe-2S)-binding protein [Planctomycetaceae bacterium]
MELGDTLCYCFHVSKRKILNYLRVHRPSRASQLSDCGGAGTGCGWCVPYLKRYFQEMREQGEVTEESLSADDYSAQRSQYIADGHGKPPS